MSKAIPVYEPIELRVARVRAQVRNRRLVHELINLTLACAAVTFLVMSLYFVAPQELRDAILTNFLGFDQPTVTFAPRPPLSL